MKIQKSRNSRQPQKDYSSVCHQQGRMLTDSDLTEQALISRDRLNAALRDVIGSGTPRQGALVQITESGGDQLPTLHWGRVYVDGIAGEVRADGTAPDSDLFDYAHQLHYPSAPALPTTPHRLYVDIWERSVTWLEDDALRDPGLHGADTSARTQTMAQVKWCDAALDPLCDDVNPTIGNARLRLVLRSLATSTDPCDPCADELQLSDAVGNYLFRVEVHDVTYDSNEQPEAVVLKWSSENGAEAYATADVPPDFASNQFVYEFFDTTSEKHLGVHLGRDASGDRFIDGRRPAFVSTFSDSSALAREFVRRWDGWCRIEKAGSDWQLTEGFEGSIDLTSGVGVDSPGHVEQGGDSVGIELRVISLTIELADFALLAGDYWSVPVREAIHRQGDLLLEDEASGDGVPPHGEPHHFMQLVDVGASGEMRLPVVSGCDTYGACQLPQFPSLTDLRAEDICVDNAVCDQLGEYATVQDALDHLCQERDLRWHNRHLHGWGIVCGLNLECDPDEAGNVILNAGYALDCDGNDLVVAEDDERLRHQNILRLLKQEDIDPDTLDEDDGLCLYLEQDQERGLRVRIERYDAEEETWVDRLRETLLYEFYDDCILGLIESLTGELQETDVEARCALTRCGRQEIRPVQRRTLTLTNILFEYKQGDGSTVLNISPCEHALLEDLYDRLRSHLRSKTFCAQFEHLDFPPYPFAGVKACRATWFTPDPLDHLRPDPDGKRVFGWRRNSDRVFVFEQLKDGCIGDLVGYFVVPQLDKGSISDLTVDRDGVIHVVGIVHEEDTLFARGKLSGADGDGCEIKIDWQTSFICGVKIVRLKASPWSTKQFYAVGLCKGVYLLEPETLFAEAKIERDPDWAFPAAGHIDFHVTGTVVVCTAASAKVDCELGEYDRLVIFNASPEAAEGGKDARSLVPIVNDRPVRGSDGLVVAPTGGIGRDAAVEIAFPESAAATPGKDVVLYLVADIGDKKTLCRFDINGLKQRSEKDAEWVGEFYHSFDVASHVALSYVRGGKLDGVVATRYAMHDMQYIPGDLKQYRSGLLDSIPVQAGPVDIVTNDALGQVHVLNHMGQSITVLDYSLQVYQEARPELRAYRADVIAAFFQLLSGLLQYLKDCFCNHLLVKCPECDDEDKVYLGCLSMRDGEVYNICNFTKRRYVKTFMSVSYWLSLIPIGPLVHWAIEQMCCLVLPNVFKRDEVSTPSISAMQLGTINTAVNTDHGRLLQAVSSAGRDVGKKGLNELVRAGYKDRSSVEDLIGTEYHYRPGITPKLKPAFAGDGALKAKLEDIEAARARTEADVEVLQSELNGLRQQAAGQGKVDADVQQLKSELSTLREDRAQEKQTADAEIAALKGEVATLRQERVLEKQTADAEVGQLKTELEALKQERTATDAKLAELDRTKSELGEAKSEIESLRGSVQPLINGAKPVGSISGLTDTNREILERNRITTIRQLAEADPAMLKELGINARTATSLVNKANEAVTFSGR
jgi:hypothetical protein